ncbi:interleukin-20 receptor subunit alpha [Stigmatopora nigra]
MKNVLLITIIWSRWPYTGSSSPPKPVNVHFTSLNLRNGLHWLPGDGTPEGTSYTVEFAIYGDTVPDTQLLNWRPVGECNQIEWTWCDLSSQTEDLYKGYYARVRAVRPSGYSEWVKTKRFHPKNDVVFGPPEMTVEVKGNDAIINLSGPIRYQSNERAPAVSMVELYPRMTYNLTVQEACQDQGHHFAVTKNNYKYKLRNFDSNYCFSAKVRFLDTQFQCKQSEKHCITTDKDPITGQVQAIVLGFLVPLVSVCVFLVVGYILYHYLTGDGWKTPKSLNVTVLQIQPLAVPLHHLIAPLRKESTTDDVDKDNGAPFMALSYVLQRPPEAPKPEEPKPEASMPEERCDYSSVAAAEDVHQEVRDSMPQKQCQRPPGSMTSYLPNIVPNPLKSPTMDLAWNPYKKHDDDVRCVAPLPDSYAVVRSSEGDQDQVGLLLAEWGSQMRVPETEGHLRLDMVCFGMPSGEEQVV